ncbi:hypothetical protein [Paraburkholderia sp. CNPSo 3281]|uniref:hypothetical protein n=1 Tax=Paraburkholderia sp. CNPSo 3281 TaxID=2940933 RepID=UPI0035CD0409
MVLFDTLQERIDSARLPLFVVTLTAAAQVNTPVLAILHWHAFRRATPLVLRPVPPAPCSPHRRSRTVYRLGAVHRILLPH